MLLFGLHAEWNSSTVRTHISFLPQLLLVTTRHAGGRKEQGLALRQEQCGCSRSRSFLYSFWSLCFSFSAAASSFVQESIKNFRERNHCFAFIQPGVPNDNPNESRTITKRSLKNHIIPIGETLAHCLLKSCFSWRMLLVQDEQQASARHGRAQMFPEWVVEMKEEDVKMKFSCETSLKIWKVEDMKTKLSYETSLKRWKLTM